MIQIQTDRVNLEIMGVIFKTEEHYDIALYLLNTNLIEGWKPTREDIQELRTTIEDMT